MYNIHIETYINHNVTPPGILTKCRDPCNPHPERETALPSAAAPRGGGPLLAPPLQSLQVFSYRASEGASWPSILTVAQYANKLTDLN